MQMVHVGDNKLKLWTGHGEIYFTLPNGVSYTAMHSIITVVIPVWYMSVLSVCHHEVHPIIPEKQLNSVIVRTMHIIIIIILNKIWCVHVHVTISFTCDQASKKGSKETKFQFFYIFMHCRHRQLHLIKCWIN